MNSWLDDIKLALANLGGIAPYDAIYKEVKRLRGEKLPESWKQIIRRTVQDHSKDSHGYKGNSIFILLRALALEFGG
jgi:hypothetical protein